MISKLLLRVPLPYDVYWIQVVKIRKSLLMHENYLDSRNLDLTLCTKRRVDSVSMYAFRVFAVSPPPPSVVVVGNGCVTDPTLFALSGHENLGPADKLRRGGAGGGG